MCFSSTLIPLCPYRIVELAHHVLLFHSNLSYYYAALRSFWMEGIVLLGCPLFTARTDNETK